MFTCPERRRDESFHSSIHDLAREFRITLSGTFTETDVPEVEALWRTAASIIGTRAFQVDLDGITHADSKARDLLARMYEAGARFASSGPEARKLAADITGAMPQAPASGHGGIRQMTGSLAALLACLALRIGIRAA